MNSGLYHLQQADISPSALTEKFSSLRQPAFFVAATPVSDNFHLWHRRLGHLSTSRMQLISYSIVSKNISLINDTVCPICPLSKLRKLSFPLSTHKSSSILELIHCDIWGPFSTVAYDGSKFFLTTVDDYSRCTWVYFLKSKSEVHNYQLAFSNMVETQFCVKIKILRSDNGAEFNLLNFFNEKEIIHQRTCVETLQQNRIVERKHQHLLNIARSLRFQANLPIQYWPACILTAVYLINRTPTPLLQNKTPFALLFKTEPQYAHLRVFGCLCNATTLSHGRKKFDAQDRRCVFLRYPFGVKGYKLLDLESNVTFLSIDVSFHEHVFPFSQLSSVLSPSSDSPPYNFTPISHYPPSPFPSLSPNLPTAPFIFPTSPLLSSPHFSIFSR